MEFMECLNEDAKKKKKGHFLYIVGKTVLIAISSNLLDTKYKFFGFNYDLRLVFITTNTGFVVMCKDSW